MTDEPDPLGHSSFRIVLVARSNGDRWPALVYTTFTNEVTIAIPVDQATEVAKLLSEGITDATAQAHIHNSGLILPEGN